MPNNPRYVAVTINTAANSPQTYIIAPVNERSAGVMTPEMLALLLDGGGSSSQFGVQSFTDETERTITIPSPYADTTYKILLTANDSVGVYYEKLSGSQFKIKTSAPFTGEVSWCVNE